MEKQMIRLEFSPKNNPEISDIKDKNDRSKNKIFTLLISILL